MTKSEHAVPYPLYSSWGFLSSFIIRHLSFEHEPPRGFKNCLVKAAPKIFSPNEFDASRRVPDEWTQNPAHLAAKKKVARQPGQQHVPGDSRSIGPLP